MCNVTYIYALVDSTTNMIHYVGRSKNPHKRLKQHLNTNWSQSAKYNWLQFMSALKREVTITILACVKNDMAKMEEQKWITKLFNAGFPLKNVEYNKPRHLLRHPALYDLLIQYRLPLLRLAMTSEASTF